MKKSVKETLATVLRRFKIENISLSTDAAGIEISYTNYDAEAAWQMYVELLTRVTTQILPEEGGDEATALSSVHNIFPVTREILKLYGRNALSFSKIAIVILNQKIRPFTAKWHKLSLENCFDDKKFCAQFRDELEELRKTITNYAHLLADMAKVEDLTCLIDE